MPLIPHLRLSTAGKLFGGPQSVGTAQGRIAAEYQAGYLTSPQDKPELPKPDYSEYKEASKQNDSTSTYQKMGLDLSKYRSNEANNSQEETQRK